MTRQPAARVRTDPRRRLANFLGSIEPAIAEDGIVQHRLNRLRRVVDRERARAIGPASRFPRKDQGRRPAPASAPPPGAFSHVDHEASLLADMVQRAENERDPVLRRRLLALAEEEADRLTTFGPDRVRGDLKRRRDERILTYVGWPSDRVARVEGTSRATVDAVRRENGCDPKNGTCTATDVVVRIRPR